MKKMKKEKNRNFERFLGSSRFHTQNPRRFPGFTVVVVTFFVKIIDDVCVFFGMCLFPKENPQPVLRGHRFSEQKIHFSLDVKQKHTFYNENLRKKSLRSAPLTIIILLESLTIPFLTAWAVPSLFFVFLFIFVWARHGCRATSWRALAAARLIVEGYRSPNEALVC